MITSTSIMVYYESMRIGGRRRRQPVRAHYCLRLTTIILLLGLILLPTAAVAWEWSDLLVLSSGGGGGGEEQTTTSTTTLSMQQVSEMRARDIKRRLTRTHGYTAEEVAKMIDKKELIGVLSFEEEKERLKQEEATKRALLQRGIIAAIVTIVVIFCWPVIQHGWEVASVNFVVYTDRKKHEASRCWELQSKWGMVGVLLMGLLDVLQVWLTASILLSWVMKSKYFFPVPHIPVRPAQFMGGEISKSSPVANYGINIGSMLVTWGLRFVYGKIESWTGRALAHAHRHRKQQQRNNNKANKHSDRPKATDERNTKAARRQAKLEKQQRKQAAQQAAVAAAANNSRQQRPGAQLPPEWMQPVVVKDEGSNNAEPVIGVVRPHMSDSHQEFLDQLGEEAAHHASELDELD